MLIVNVPRTCLRERRYAVDVVLNQFLGAQYVLVAEERRDVMIHLSGSPSPAVYVDDTFFRVAAVHWLGVESLPRLPLESWEPDDISQSALGARALPVVFGSGHDSAFVSVGVDIHLGIDIFGTAFFLLTRYEEVVIRARDALGRFPAESSIAAAAEFLDRALVNEYVEVLWAVLRRQWPQLTRRVRQPRVFLTHDVDVPCCAFGVQARALVRSAVGDLMHRRDWRLARERLIALLRPPICAENDPCFTFAWLMSRAEMCGWTAEFNFIPNREPLAEDGPYSLADSYIAELMSAIVRRGHRVGYHASFRSADDAALVQREFDDLRCYAKAQAIEQPIWGGRYHYLRWSPDSWGTWARAGLTYDSSVGFPERVGFRCGTCYEFQAYDLRSRAPLSLVERPLTAMDVTLCSRRYAGMNPKSAVQAIRQLAATCERFNGDFVLLWHNDMVVTNAGRQLYDEVLREVASRFVVQ